MDYKVFLHKENYEGGTIQLEDKIYKLTDNHFLTIGPKDSYKFGIV